MHLCVFYFIDCSQQLNLLIGKNISPNAKIIKKKYYLRKNVNKLTNIFICFYNFEKCNWINRFSMYKHIMKIQVIKYFFLTLSHVFISLRKSMQNAYLVKLLFFHSFLALYCCQYIISLN